MSFEFISNPSSEHLLFSTQWQGPQLVGVKKGGGGGGGESGGKVREIEGRCEAGNYPVPNSLEYKKVGVWVRDELSGCPSTITDNGSRLGTEADHKEEEISYIEL